MKSGRSRLDFLKASVAAGAATWVGTSSGPATPLASPMPGTSHMKKALQISMLPKQLSYAERFKLLREVGFEAVEAQTVSDEREAQEIKKAADDAKVRIHSVMNMAHWDYPLSSSDPAVVEKSLDGMRTSLRNARLWGAETVLLVPAVVNPQTSYREAWVRSQKQIRKLLPLAEELKIVIALEEVWNKFLLSPLAFPKYVDEFQSPWVRSYFDVGNVVLTGYPQDWIRAVGPRIRKLHIKDFRFRKMQAEFVPLREGDIDWLEVHKALGEIGYHGTATVELEGGGEAYLREVNRRFELILSGA